MTMHGIGFDEADMVTRIERFGHRHMISGRLVNRMLTIAEELCMQAILPHIGTDEELRLSFEYDDANGGTIALEITYPGGSRNPLAEADELVLPLVGRACPDLSWTCSNGISTVRGHITATDDGK